MKGTITQVVRNRGFAFIRGEDGLSRFAHARAFESSIAFDLAFVGQEVTFTPCDDGPKNKGGGLRATEVKVCAESC